MPPSFGFRPGRLLGAKTGGPPRLAWRSALLVQLRSPARGLPGLEGAALVEKLAVAFDRGAIDAESAGGLDLGDSFFDRFDDLSSEVKRICTYASTIPGAPSSQSAVTAWGALVESSDGPYPLE